VQQSARFYPPCPRPPWQRRLHLSGPPASLGPETSPVSTPRPFVRMIRMGGRA
jgi:hypothetical protein